VDEGVDVLIMGKPLDPDYWKKYRAAHPSYRKKEAERRKQRKAAMTAEERQKDRGIRKSRAIPEVPLLMPHLLRGGSISFWEDELRLDLEQERQLALLENRNPDQALKEYRSREYTWKRLTASILDDTYDTGIAKIA
jgi:hypothetical protein